MLRRIILKFIISGGLAAIVNLGTFSILMTRTGLHYITASIAAFSAAALVSFCLQKFWTFENMSLEEVHIQFPLFIAIVSTNLAINTLLVYSFVNFAGLGHFISQMLAGILVAVESFFVFRHIIFKHKTAASLEETI